MLEVKIGQRAVTGCIELRTISFLNDAPSVFAYRGGDVVLTLRDYHWEALKRAVDEEQALESGDFEKVSDEE